MKFMRSIYTDCSHHDSLLTDMFQKDADPDIPILREAKAEYAKLQ